MTPADAPHGAGTRGGGGAEPTARDPGAAVGGRQPPTVGELVGAAGVVVGLAALGGPVGVAAGVAVVVLRVGFGGVPAVAAGQFALAAFLPARLSPALLTPDVVGTQAALLVLLVAGSRGRHRAGQVRRALGTGAAAALLTALALGVGAGLPATAVGERTAAVAAAGAFAVGSGLLVVSAWADRDAGEEGDVGDGAGGDATR